MVIDEDKDKCIGKRKGKIKERLKSNVKLR